MDRTCALQPTGRPGAAFLLAFSALLPSVGLAQVPPRCNAEVQEHLAALPLYEGEITDVRVIEGVNLADDFGPEVFGVDAWVRLESCSGFLVLNLNKNCFLRQAYTRGDCEVQGLSKH